MSAAIDPVTTTNDSDEPQQTAAKLQVEINKDGEFHTARNLKRKYIIEYHRDVCIGAASCAAIASATFGMDDENKAFLIGEGDWDDEELILAAAQSCPVFAIIIKDAETGEQLFPEVF
jgi:ferredoxin